ncbi:CKLF like MARVEL transmembrane domain containing 1 [Phyllostomus discolor]|uniref:CKLF like MARVEL transmembrane domain containing 1 n=1 Tax=Phyllostomus discolor TaxID=89673 RepID=A0A834DBR6_9CHIR|nr:CKLF like MARVEL transmembrane domain containing 1 [Phyllostomus discolor]
MQSNDTKEPLEDLPSQGPPPTQPVPKGPPASEQPASGPPASEQPASGPPASEQPASGPPASEQPASEQPASGPPASGPPATGRPGRGAPKSQRPAKPKPPGKPTHPGKPTRPGHPEPSVQTAPSQKSTAPLLPKAPEPGALSQSEKEAIRNRAAGRAKVPSKFRDSIKHFFFLPTGALKILRLGLLIGSATCFLIAEAHESYIVITILETCIVLFFILIYMLTLHRLTNFMNWSLLLLSWQCKKRKEGIYSMLEGPCVSVR